MKITVSPQAAAWFKEEVGILPGHGIQFKAKVYGSSPISEGFSLYLEPAMPNQEIGAEFVADNDLKFFVDQEDIWFFDGHDLSVEFDERLKEPKYIYLKDGKPLNS